MQLSPRARRAKEAKKNSKKIRFQRVNHIARHLEKVHWMALKLLDMKEEANYSYHYDSVVRRNMKHYRPGVEFDI